MLYLVIHHHRHGEDHLVVSADHEPTEAEVLDTGQIDWEPERGEYLEILSLDVEHAIPIGAPEHFLATDNTTPTV